MTSEIKPIVLDNGSGMIKAGFAGDDFPQTVFPSIIGKSKYNANSLIIDKTNYIGEEACSKAGNLFLRNAIEHGFIHWDLMENIWYHTFFHQLRVDPTEHPVLLIEPSKNPKNYQISMIEHMFETFNIPSLYLCDQGYLSLYSTGLDTGTVLYIGEGVTHSTSFYEGYSLSTIAQKIGGIDVSNFLLKLMNESGYSFLTGADKLIIKDIKEKICYVALNYDEELNKAKTSSACDSIYTLPDGNRILIHNQRFRCGELLFNPYLEGFEYDGVHNIVYNSINKCDFDLRPKLYSNILLSGGSTKFKGFSERLVKEIKKLVLPGTQVNIISNPNSDYAAWIGGSIFASKDVFKDLAFTYEQYKENGPVSRNVDNSLIYEKFYFTE